MISKYADLTTVFKKSFQGPKKNFRSVTILPINSKSFEKTLGKKLQT